jgi:hypothetical protein
MQNTEKSPKNKAQKNKAPNTKKGPGRPRYVPKWPQGKFTFHKLMVLNEVDPETKRGPKCTGLTLWKNLQKELGRKGLFMKVKDVLGEPNGAGAGRKPFIYCRRPIAAPAAKAAIVPAAKIVAAATDPAPVESTTVPVEPRDEVTPETVAYETRKQTLLGLAPLTVPDEDSPAAVA